MRSFKLCSCYTAGSQSGRLQLSFIPYQLTIVWVLSLAATAIYLEQKLGRKTRTVNNLK